MAYESSGTTGGSSSTGFGSSSPGFSDSETNADPFDRRCGCPNGANTCLTFEGPLRDGWGPVMDGLGELPVPREDTVVCGRRRRECGERRHRPGVWIEVMP